MSNLSIRAFDQAQRRKKYPERKGALGVAYLQRDISSAQKYLSEISEILWSASGDTTAEYLQSPSGVVYNKISDMALILLQLSGALGIDLVSVMKHRIEKEEVTVL